MGDDNKDSFPRYTAADFDARQMACADIHLRQAAEFEEVNRNVAKSLAERAIAVIKTNPMNTSVRLSAWAKDDYHTHPASVVRILQENGYSVELLTDLADNFAMVFDFSKRPAK